MREREEILECVRGPSRKGQVQRSRGQRSRRRHCGASSSAAHVLQRKLRHGLVDNLIRVTEPEGGVRTRGSRALHTALHRPHTP